MLINEVTRKPEMLTDVPLTAVTVPHLRGLHSEAYNPRKRDTEGTETQADPSTHEFTIRPQAETELPSMISEMETHSLIQRLRIILVFCGNCRSQEAGHELHGYPLVCTGHGMCGGEQAALGPKYDTHKRLATAPNQHSN
jgi:hypothetical protein